jgi:hypothetical protein
MAMVVAILLLVSAPVRAAEPAGSLTALEGQAEVLRAGTTAWAALAEGESLYEGDQVRTLADSKAKLTFRDESIFTLASASTLTVTAQDAAATAPKSSFSLLVGTVRAVVTEKYSAPGAKFEMDTPTAVAAVHGTGFIATYDPALDESVFVGLFDTTLVRAATDVRAAHVVRLGPGDTTRVGRGSFPVKPTRAPEGVMRGLNAATTIVPSVSGPGQKGGGVGGPGKAGASARSGNAASAPEAPIDQPVESLKRSKRKPAPPPPPVPR